MESNRAFRLVRVLGFIFAACLIAPLSVQLDYLSEAYLLWPLIMLVVLVRVEKSRLFRFLLAFGAIPVVLLANKQLTSIVLTSMLLIVIWIFLLGEVTQSEKSLYIYQIIFMIISFFLVDVIMQGALLYPWEQETRFIIVSQSSIRMTLYAVDINSIMLLLFSDVLFELPIIRKLLIMKKLDHADYSNKYFIWTVGIGILFLLVDGYIDSIFFNISGIHTSFMRITSGEKLKICIYISILSFLAKTMMTTKRRHLADLAEIKAREEEILTIVNTVDELNKELEYHISVRTTQLDRAYSDIESFSYTVSHELKTPIHEIESYIEFIREDNKEWLSEQSLQDMQSVQHICKTTIRLIQQMMEYSKIGYALIEYVEVDMTQIVEECAAEILEETKNSNLTLKIEKLPFCQGDRFLIKRMVSNILSNSVKFTQTMSNPEIHIYSVTDATWNIYFFQDNGVGFDMKYAKRIFGIFERFHNESEFEGSGIGLATVKNIVTRLGGDVSIQAEINQGCQVCVKLPIDTVSPTQT